MAPMKETVNDMEMTPDSAGNGYRLCILGDLNGWIGDRRKHN